MLDFCSKHGIACDIEVVPIQKVNEAYERVLKSDVRYRFVIDMASLLERASSTAIPSRIRYGGGGARRKPPSGLLEQATDGEVHSALAGGADTAGQRDWTDNRVGDYSEVECAANDDRPGIVSRCSERRASLIPSAPVDSSSKQRRQAVQFAAKSERRVSVVVSYEFVGQVGSEPERPPERENLKRAGGTAEGCAAGHVKEERCFRPDGTKLEVCTSTGQWDVPARGFAARAIM